MSGVEEQFGVVSSGDSVKIFSLDGGAGVTGRVMNYGATLVSLNVPDPGGESVDTILGFDSVSEYESARNQYFGATIGRVANRIAQASFRDGGKEYQLLPNEGPHHLHGGRKRSFDKVVWDVVSTTSNEVELAHRSPAGEEGYPGTVQVSANYRIVERTLSIRYRAQTSARSPLNMTNHAYFNLGGAGKGTVLDHDLMVYADRFTPVDDELIPTGEIASVAGTPLDFRKYSRIGRRIGELFDTGAGGYDHNFVLREGVGKFGPAAELSDPASGRAMLLFTNQPGVQVYTGNQIYEKVPGKSGMSYEQFGGICLEPQHFPDSVHNGRFPSIFLDPGQVYEHYSEYHFIETP